MDRVVALLRSVNIGGRRVAMERLREGLRAAGCTDVVTYLQSGNVVLTPPGQPRADLVPWLEERLRDISGFDVRVVLRTADELARIVAANPYPAAGGTSLHVIFCADAPSPPALGALDAEAFAPEQWAQAGGEIYLHLPNGMGRAVLPAAVGRALGRHAVTTTRNWNTVVALADLAAG